MPLVHLPPLPLLLSDVFAWLLLHVGISWGLRQVSDAFFEREARWFRSFPFEEGGRIWHKWLHIRDWKDYLPDGTLIAKKGFDKSSLEKSDSASLAKFIIETRRAELTHWLLIPPALLFFLWNPVWVGWIMIIYAFIANLPFIIIQRFNRPRLESVLARIERRNNDAYKNKSMD